MQIGASVRKNRAQLCFSRSISAFENSITVEKLTRLKPDKGRRKLRDGSTIKPPTEKNYLLLTVEISLFKSLNHHTVINVPRFIVRNGNETRFVRLLRIIAAGPAISELPT